jgi:hypothetical protein
MSTSVSTRKSLLWLVAVGFFMQTLDATSINTALPAMAASLGESPLRIQSVVVAYSLTDSRWRCTSCNWWPSARSTRCSSPR